MTNRFPRRVSVLAFLMFSLCASVWAAKKPASKEELIKEATHIITAKVVEVTSKIERSKFEKGAGNRDEVFSIRVKVESPAKGKDIKLGDEILVIAWKAHTRIGAAKVAWQGHDPISKKGQVATFYLKKDGKKFEPIMPNGIVMKEK